MSKAKLLSVTLHRECDVDPDTSYLGEYTDTASPECYIRIGEHAGKQVKELGDDDTLPERGREYRYFLPAMTGEDTGNMDSPRQDYERMENLQNGHWCYIGIWASAEIQLTGDTVQTIRSAGLWGIESDSDTDHIESVEREELAALYRELKALGISRRTFDAIELQHAEQ